MRGSVKLALEALVRSSLVLKKPSSYGDRFSLNRDKLPEIERTLEEDL